MLIYKFIWLQNLTFKTTFWYQERNVYLKIEVIKIQQQGERQRNIEVEQQGERQRRTIKTHNAKQTRKKRKIQQVELINYIEICINGYLQTLACQKFACEC